LTQTFGDKVSVTTTVGRVSSFEVTVGEKLVWSKIEAGSFPDQAKLVADVITPLIA
jgi:selT/selW/selH-like putative selenoprotein